MNSFKEIYEAFELFFSIGGFILVIYFVFVIGKVSIIWHAGNKIEIVWERKK